MLHIDLSQLDPEQPAVAYHTRNMREFYCSSNNSMVDLECSDK